MAKSYVVTFAGDKVGLIVRGKTSPAHEPGVMEQHADVILPDGSPVGFFGEGNDGSFNKSGLGMDGTVYDFSELRKHRPYYIDCATARGYGVLSTFLIFAVSATEAKKFSDYWGGLDKSPGSFNILGGNCSTRASGSFQAAGILSGGIPGLDTPNNLYLQLHREKGKTALVDSGYIGFSPRGRGFDLVVDVP
jgi:hypothetical protein